MGGCITPPKKPKAPIPTPTPKKQSIDPLNTTLDNINNNNNNNTKQTLNITNPSLPQKPKYKKITGQQFTRLYRIQDNIDTTSRVQGPKYISNYSDGIGRVLRIIPYNITSSMVIGGIITNKQQQIQKRIKIYSQILNLDIYQDQQNNLLILQDYYCGAYLNQLSYQQTNQQQIRIFLSQIYTIIDTFHQKNQILGNLSIFSFRQTSQFDNTVRLIQLNLINTLTTTTNTNSNTNTSTYTSTNINNIQQNMGHAFKSQKSMDWQSFGYIVQSVYIENPPIFIQHKLQYIEINNNTINTLLKGKKIKRQQLDNIKYYHITNNNNSSNSNNNNNNNNNNVDINNINLNLNPNNNNNNVINNIYNSNKILNGYKFRYDLIKLLKLRKRRIPHRTIYYSQDILTNGIKLSDQSLQRIQTNRIIQRIQKYIQYLGIQCQQIFLMYTTANQTLKKMKIVFNVVDKNKKMEEFKQILPLIK